MRAKHDGGGSTANGRSTRVSFCLHDRTRHPEARQTPWLSLSNPRAKFLASKYASEDSEDASFDDIVGSVLSQYSYDFLMNRQVQGHLVLVVVLNFWTRTRSLFALHVLVHSRSSRLLMHGWCKCLLPGLAYYLLSSPFRRVHHRTVTSRRHASCGHAVSHDHYCTPIFASLLFASAPITHHSAHAKMQLRKCRNSPFRSKPHHQF